MKAMQLRAPRAADEDPLALVELPEPDPAPGEIVLQVTACAVCRTDLQICTGDLAPRTLPIVPGHQAVGRVVACGDGVQGFTVGDRAGVAWLASACGRCARCREGRENLCAEARFTGWDRDGGFAERLTALADYALPVPDAFDDLHAAPLLCGGVIGFRAFEATGVREGQRLGLFGFGASASLTIQVARHVGCRVFVCTRSHEEQLRARALGAEWVGGYEDRLPEPLDAAITFAPAGRVVVHALQALDRGGTVVVNAIHLDGIPAFSYDALWWERSMRSVANFTRRDARAFLALAGRIPVTTSFDEYALEDANVALRDLQAGRVRGAALLRIAGTR